MPRAVKLASGWSAGEWSPYLKTRVDLPQYVRSLRRCVNYIVTAEGALIRRPPTKHLGDTKFPDGGVAAFEFVPDFSNSYVVEAGDFYMRFWTQNGLVRDGSNNIIELTTPYSANEVGELSVSQDADVLYIVHPNHLPRKLRRTSLAPTFDLVQVTFLGGRAPLNTMNTSSVTMTVSGTWPSVTVTASANTFIAADVGRIIYIRDINTKRGVYIRIDVVSSPTVVSGTGVYRAGDTAGLPGTTRDWALGLFSANRGCRAVTFHEGRLWYGGFTDAPDVIVGSVSNSFDDFETTSPDPTVNDAANADKAITRRANSGSVETVLWMLSGADVLLLGTAGAEYIVRPGVAGFLTPTEAAVRRVTGRGSEPSVRPIRIDNQAFFTQRGGQRLRQIRYDIESDGFTTEDATLLFSHMTQSGIRRVAYQQSPWSVLWFTDNLDRLYGITIEGQQQVVGGHRHFIGGGVRGRNARVWDIASVPIVTQLGAGRVDGLFMIVQRTLNGNLVRSMELIEPVPVITDERQPAERLIYYAESTAYVDSYKKLSNDWRITDGGEESGVLRFYVSGTPPAVSTPIVIRGLVWRSGQTIVSRTAAVRTRYVVQATGANWFTIADPDAPTVALTPADVGLPSGVKLALEVDEWLARADQVVTSVSFPAQESGDNYVVVADGRVVSSGTLPEPASIVVGGYTFRSEFETNILFLQGSVPADAGEPSRLSHPTLWLWGGIDAWVQSGNAQPQRVVTATTANLMDALPSPAFRPVTVHVDSDAMDGATIRCYTESPYVCDVLGLSYVLRTNPR